jgi:hypothetical protein
VKKRPSSFRVNAMLLCISTMLVLFSSLALAQTAPQGPDSILSSQLGRHQNNSDPVAVYAKAGNVTALVISHVTTTQSWQGYYGNVTGTITLDDANNQTLYDWSLPDPQGEIYASNYSVVDWTKIYCINTSGIRPQCSNQNGANLCYNGHNGTQLELSYGINLTDRDGVNETFNGTFTGSFRTGAITIDSVDGCSMANPYVDDAWASSWQELILTDNVSIIFTSIIRENGDGYKTGTEPADFQMLVLENGHAGYENAMSIYYFFVELS